MRSASGYAQSARENLELVEYNLLWARQGFRLSCTLSLEKSPLTIALECTILSWSSSQNLVSPCHVSVNFMAPYWCLYQQALSFL